MIMTILCIMLAWAGGASAMWLYLRFSKLIRNQAEHRKALSEAPYHPKDTKGLAGAIYRADATEFRKFVKAYFKDQRDLLLQQGRRWRG